VVTVSTEEYKEQKSFKDPPLACNSTIPTPPAFVAGTCPESFHEQLRLLKAKECMLLQTADKRETQHTRCDDSGNSDDSGEL
jgi:hypothetical protein